MTPQRYRTGIPCAVCQCSTLLYNTPRGTRFTFRRRRIAYTNMFPLRPLHRNVADQSPKDHEQTDESEKKENSHFPPTSTTSSIWAIKQAAARLSVSVFITALLTLSARIVLIGAAHQLEVMLIHRGSATMPASSSS